MGIQAKSQAETRSLQKDRIEFALFTLFLFLAGITAGIWVSLNYFNEEIAEQEVPRTPMPGRMDRIIVVPAWLDHPYSHTVNPFMADFRYRAHELDLNALVFGTSAYAALPREEDYGTLRARGLMNADGERAYSERMMGNSQALLGRISHAQTGRLSSRMNPEALRSLRVPGMVLYLAAAAATGRPVSARLGDHTTLRSQTVNKDDYRLQVDHRISAIGLFIGSAYDSIDQRRSLSLTQSLGSNWAVGVDRMISNVDTDTQSAVRVQFSAGF